MGNIRWLPVALALVAASCVAAPRAAEPAPTEGAPVSPVAAVTPTPSPSANPAVSPAPTPAATVSAPVGAPIDLHLLALDLGASLDGTVVADDPSCGGSCGVALAGGPTGTWTSAWREPGFAFTRLVPSWNADTPHGTWITVEAQARRASGGETAWYSMGTWALGDGVVRRATVNGQQDGDARVDTDTLHAAVPLSAYRVRVTLHRADGFAGTPLLRLVAAVASDDAAVRAAPGSAHAGTVAEIAVPAYSQEIHAGEYPRYDGGGEAWCSPTSTTMVLARWDRGPSPADLEWVDPSYADPQVDHAARSTYDAAYRGTGNWAFNTAYAASFGLRAFVTQLRSLAEAERFIAAGIPLVVSINVPPGGLPGFLFERGTPGHLLVVSGFTASGDVVAHDPAALSNATVPRVYPRGAFERVWVGGSGGITYVIHPPDVPLPERVAGATANW